ncbi:MAG: hypothetical protein ACOYL6_13055 [Bacteriovoracaceae bacterium]
MKMFNGLLKQLSMGVFLLSMALPVFAGVGDLCPGGAKVVEVVENSTQGRYVKCDDGTIYILTGGGINGSKDPATYKKIDGDWSVIITTGTVIGNGNGNGNIGGIFGSQFPSVKGGATTPGSTSTTTTTTSGGGDGGVGACLQKCNDRWDGTSSRQIRKRKECRASCADDIVISGGGGGGTTTGGGGSVIIRGGGGGGANCDYSTDVRICIGDDNYYNIHSNSGVDCPECSANKQHWTSGVAEIFGAVMPSLASFGSNAMWANAYLGSNQAAADAQKAGYEQCRLGHQNYLDYLSKDSLPGLTPDSYGKLNCNGYAMNQFAGYGGGFQGNGYGGFGNPLLSAGYSPGFIGGMISPYGGNIGGQYGIGGGLYGNGGFPGIGAGINIGGGWGGNGGFPGGNGGWGGNGGFPGGNGGWGGNVGFPGGNGGWGGNGGFPGGNGGWGGNGGINIGGGFGGNNPWGGSYYGNPNGFGVGAGTVPWNTGGGGYFNGSGGFNGNGNGGWGNGGFGQGGFGDPNQSYYARMQSNMYGSQYQQQSLQRNFNGAQQDLYGSMYNSGFGNAGFNPGNLGYGLSAGFNFGGGLGGGFY